MVTTWAGDAQTAYEDARAGHNKTHGATYDDTTDVRPTDSGVPFADLLTAVRPPEPVRQRFLESGRWRRRTVLHDLHRGAAAHPDRAAVVAHRADRPPATRVTRVTYAQLALYADRFAHALDALGIGPGDPVAFQLPNRWEACALALACLRTGAVAVPLLTGYGARDLEAALAATEARLCVVTDHWGGTDPARTLAGLAPALPWLRHRAVLGDAAPTGAVDFVRHFVRTPHERHRPTAWLRAPAEPADRICLATATMELRGAPTLALHSPNSLYAAASSPEVSGAPVAWSPLPLGSSAALLHTVLGPLARGGTAVLQDVWDADTALDLFAAAGVTEALATSAQWAELVAAQRRHPRLTHTLSRALRSDPPPDGTDEVAPQVRETFGLRLAAPGPAVPDGPGSPLAVWRRDTGGLRPTWPHGEAGRLRRPEPELADETGEMAEEIGGLFLLPVAELEQFLARHPAVSEAAVVPCADPVHGELACAVVVPAGAPPGLLDLRDHLLRAGLAPAHLPARLELVGGLPYGPDGTLDRPRLRARLAHRLGPPAP